MGGLLGYAALGAAEGVGKGMVDSATASMKARVQKNRDAYLNKVEKQRHDRNRGETVQDTKDKIELERELHKRNRGEKVKDDKAARASAERIAGVREAKAEDKRLATRRGKYLDKKDALIKGARTEMQKLQVRKSKVEITDTEYNAAMKDIEKYYSWQERSLKERYGDIFSNEPQTGTPPPVTPPPVMGNGAFGDTGTPERPLVETPTPVTKLPDQVAAPSSKGLMAQIGDTVRGNQQVAQVPQQASMLSDHPLDYFGNKLYDAVTQRAK